MDIFDKSPSLSVSKSVSFLSEIKSKEDQVTDYQHVSDIEISQALEELDNVNAYLYSIEALMERIFETRVSKNVELKFKEIATLIKLIVSPNEFNPVPIMYLSLYLLRDKWFNKLIFSEMGIN